MRILPRAFRESSRHVHLERARALRRQGSYEESRRVLDQLVRRDPGDPVIERELQSARAAPELDRAMTIDDPDEAAATTRELVQRFPEDPDVHLWLAAALVARGDPEEGASHARRGAELAGDNPYRLLRAASAVRWAEPATAREYFDRANALFAKEDRQVRRAFEPDLHYLEGTLLFDEGERERALACLKRAFELDPKDAIKGGDLAQAYLRHGQTDAALDVIARALQHAPDSERLLALRAQVKEQIA